MAALLLVSVSQAGGPGDAVAAAAADMAQVPPPARPFTRYFSAYNLAGPDVAEIGKALAFWCNSLSREPDIERPILVSPGLWRVDIRWYGWKRETWERLAAVDPYFHVLGERAVEAVAVEQFDEFGYYRKRGTDDQVTKAFALANPTTTEWVTTRRVPKVAVVPGRKTDIAQPAPWLPAEYGALALATESNLPVCRADWWIYQTGMAKDRVAGYYDWLGLGKKEEDFQELIGADVKLARRVRKEIAAAVARSGVTLNNRSMERFATLTGAYWRTHDFKTSTFKQNTIRLLDGDTEPPRGDASEQYGSLPNELFAFWLQNEKGERQDAAPDFIAGDGHSTSPDKRVHAGVSCVRCHSPGIQPITDWMRSVYTERAGLALGSADYEKYRRLKQLYLSDLDGHVKADQQRYTAALLKCNGLTSQANAAAFSRVWERYADTDLDAKTLAAECGCTEQALLAALKRQKQVDPVLAGLLAVPEQALLAALKRQKQVDPVLAGLLAVPPQGIRREHIEESFSIAMGYLKGVTK